MMRLIATVVLVLLCSPAFAQSTSSISGGSTGTVSPEAIPNVVLLIIDDVGDTAFSSVSTPQMDTIATNGVTFSNSWTTPMCTPTRASLISGLYMSHNGARAPAVFDYATEFYGLGTALWDNATNRVAFGAFGKDSSVNTGYSSDMGRQRYAGYSGNLQAVGISYVEWTEYFNNAPTSETRDETWTSYSATGYADVVLTDSAIAWMTVQVAASKPFVAWLGYHLPHAPFHDASDGSTDGLTCPLANDEACYDTMLSKVDTEIGRVIAYLTSAGIIGNTYVIVLGDNGSPTGIHGGGKASAAEIGISTPFIVGHGGVTATGTLTDLVQDVDIYATILDLMDARGQPATYDTVDGDDRFNGQTFSVDGISFKCHLMTCTNETWWPDSAQRSTSYLLWTGVSYTRDEAGYKLKHTTATSVQNLYYLPTDETTDLCSGGCPTGLSGADLTAYNVLDAARIAADDP